MGWQGNFVANIDCQSGVGGDTGLSVFSWWKGMVAAGGWTVVQSGDSVSINPSGDIFSGCGGGFPGTAIPSDWTNTGAWVVLRMVGTTLEMAIWRSTTSSYNQQGHFQIKLSPTGFSDNTNRTASRPPDAADQVSLLGTLPTSFGAFCDYNYDLWAHAGCDDYARNGVYRHYCLTVRQGTNTPHSLFFFDCGDHGVIGDPEPWIAWHNYRSGGNPAVLAYLESASAGPEAYRDYGGGGELWCVHQALSLGAAPSAPGALVQQVDGYVRGIPLIYYSPVNGSWKGASRSFHWNPISSRTYPDRDKASSTDDEANDAEVYSGPSLYVDDLIIPWAKDTVPLG